MIRRLTLTVGALVAAASLTACNAVPNSDAVATIDGHTLTRAQLDNLSAHATDGATVRNSVTNWLRVGAIGGDLGKVTDQASIETEGNKALTSLTAPLMDAAKANYEKGLAGASLVCLRVIVVTPPTTGSEVLAALKGGLSFADAATKYDTSSGLAATGGVVTDQTSGAECYDPNGSVMSGLLPLLQKASAQVGVPVLISANTSEAVVLLRPFDELSDADKSSLVQSAAQPVLRAAFAKAKITVDPHFGYWDAKTASVVPMSTAG